MERVFFIPGSLESPYSDVVELWATPDHTGVWVQGRGTVMASLDITSGVFLDLRGVSRDGGLSLDEQERTHGNWIGEHPAWTTEDGVLLASWDRERDGRPKGSRRRPKL